MKKLTSLALSAIFTLSSVTPAFANTNFDWPPSLRPATATALFDLNVRANYDIPPLFPIEYFFTFPETLSFSINSAGNALYFVSPVDGILNLFRRDISTSQETQLTFETEQHISNFFMKNDTMMFLRDGFGDENINIFRIEEDGSSTNLTPFPGTTAVPMDLLENSDIENEILIMMNLEDPVTFNIYRLNVVTGDIYHVMSAVDGAMTDRNATIRIIAQTDGFNMHIFHRYTDDDDFALSGIIPFTDLFFIFEFDYNNEYVWAITNIGRETAALVRINPANLDIVETVFEHERYDINNIFGGFFTPGMPGGVIYHDDFPNRVFLTEEAENFFTELYELIPGRNIVGVTGISDDHNIATVSVRSDVNRSQVFLFNRLASTLELLTDTNFTTPDNMANMTPVRFTARDGWEIPGYLTIPVGVEATNLPVVVLPHGGPHVRDYWAGFFEWVQFLANRGYAVFQPNFRGSAGYGRTFLSAGHREWGMAMQDDVTDGVHWLIEQGIADPDRIAIFGASYGGYKALAGATFTPDLFAAAISLVGVSNLFTWIDNIPPVWESLREYLHYRVGHPVYDYERLRATSPVFHVENITIPLFIAHGANDIRVTLLETTQMIEAMQARGVDVHYMIFEDEGHGIAFEHNNIAFFNTLEGFLAEYIGSR